MKFLTLFTLLVVGLAGFCRSIPAQSVGGSTQAITNSLGGLKNAPIMDGESFCCESMVHAVNNLRHLGKDDALKVLRTYLQEHGSHPFSKSDERVMMVCRLLFVNPDGWKPPRYGEPYPEVNEREFDKNQLFPLALYHGVPFLLIYGYNAGGYTSDTADKCLQLCEGFSLITKDLPENGYEVAARAFVESHEFRTIYLHTNELPYVENMILGQARCDDPMTRRGIEVKDVKISNPPQTNSTP